MLDCDLFNRRTAAALWGSNQTFAVVGNGPVGPESTPHITAADVVVRFNNFDVRNGIDQAHRTSRGDVLVTHFDCLPTKGRVFPVILHAIPPPFQLERNARLSREWSPAERHLMVNAFDQLALCRELGLPSLGHAHPLPTVGFTWLWHAHQNVRMRACYVCGFTWRWDQSTDTFDGKRTADLSAQPANHSYLREARWVQRTLLGDARYTFAPDALHPLSALARHESLPWENCQARRGLTSP